jgi:cell division protein ZapA
LSCDEGQEESLKELATFLDKKYSDLKKNLGSIGENKLLLITTIKLIDEYFDLKKKVNVKKSEFENLSSKFKEIKSLAINYKNEKETEINNLKDEINKLQSLIEDSRTLYENMLDKTTKSIEDFIENTESEKNIQ